MQEIGKTGARIEEVLLASPKQARKGYCVTGLMVEHHIPDNNYTLPILYNYNIYIYIYISYIHSLWLTARSALGLKNGPGL